jgi:exonuclease III
MTGITTYLSVLTLNVNGLNSPIKRQRLMNWIKKEDPTICCLQETHLTDRNKYRLRTKGWKIYEANGP